MGETTPFDPGVEDLPPFDENPSHVLYDLLAERVETPFPSNYYIDPEQGGIVLNGGDFSCSLLPMVDTFSDYQAAARLARGFATYAPLVFLTSVPVDPSSLPANGAESLDPSSSVRLVALDNDFEPADPVPLKVEYRMMDSQDGPRYIVTSVPLEPLEPGTTYLYVMTDALRDADGGAFGRSRGFAQVMGHAAVITGDSDRHALVLRERERLAPLVDGLADPDAVVAAVDFTVSRLGDDTIEIMDSFLKDGRFTSVNWDMDGANDVSWGSGYKECKMTDDELAYGIHATFENVNFVGPDEQYVKEDGVWKTFEPEDLEFWLMVPAGEGPFPVVIMTHGIAADHKQLCGVSRDLVRAKIATLRFDLPRHGKRGGGAMDFLDLGWPAKTRDNFMQSSVDIAGACLLIEGLGKELDLLPKGATDGEGDLDATRIGFLGHSLGGIVGAMYFPFSDRVHASVLNVAGVGLFHMVESYVLPEGTGGLYEIMGMVHAAPHMIFSADGATFAHHILSDPFSEAHEGKHILVQEVMGDGTVPNASTELLARFGAIPLLEPFVSAIDGVLTAAPSETTSGVWQIADADHGMFTGSTSDPKVAFVRNQAVQFLASFFDTGVPEIVVE